MATLQYIGARYVPKFATPYEWDINATYEALTIVGYQGNSYTSKIPVPAGVQISNEKYWALTNSQSGAVANLETRLANAETEINSLQDISDGNTDDIATLQTNVTKLDVRVTALENETVTDAVAYKIPTVIISDSYNNNPPNISWASRYFQLTGLTPNVNGFSFAESGGHVGGGPERNTLSLILTNGAATMTADQKKSIRRVIFTIGYNDATNNTFAEVEAGTIALISQIENTFPNLEEVFVMEQAWSPDPTVRYNLINLYSQFDNRFASVVRIGRPYKSLSNIDMYYDAVHPNDKGAHWLAAGVYAALSGGEFINNGFSPISVGATNIGRAYKTSNGVLLQFYNISISLSEPVEINYNGTSIGAFTCNTIFGSDRNEADITLMATVKNSTTNAVSNIPLTFKFSRASTGTSAIGATNVLVSYKEYNPETGMTISFSADRIGLLSQFMFISEIT